MRETRTYTMQDLQLRADGEEAAPRLSGYAAVFNSLSEDLGGFREKIAAGAFAKPLENNDDVRLLINHEGLPLARTKSRTLALSEDERGLRVDAELAADDPDVARLLPKLKRGDLNQMSFAFNVDVDEWDQSKTPMVRTIRSVGRLFDVSLVTYPAYPKTSVKARDIAGAAGLDLDALTALLVKVERGLPLLSVDQEMIERSIATLRGYLPASETPDGAREGTGATPPQRRLTLHRARLMLAELEA
jgi:HK97 family phage prohead protease